MGKCMVNLREKMGEMHKTIYCNRMEIVATTLQCATWLAYQPVSYCNTRVLSRFGLIAFHR
jgi:hypothetical protein